jgi:hypothetical protein
MLPLEVRIVWRHAWRIPTAFYMLDRYGVLIHSWVVVSTIFKQDRQETWLDQQPGIGSVVGVPDHFELVTVMLCGFWHNYGCWSIPMILLISEGELLTTRRTER